MKKPKIGFIGLGVMGGPMARHLAKGGYRLAVYDKERAAADRVSGEFEQVQTVESPKQVAALSDIVITMLPTGRHVRDVITGKDGRNYRPCVKQFLAKRARGNGKRLQFFSVLRGLFRGGLF